MLKRTHVAGLEPVINSVLVIVERRFLAVRAHDAHAPARRNVAHDLIVAIRLNKEVPVRKVHLVLAHYGFLHRSLHSPREVLHLGLSVLRKAELEERLDVRRCHERADAEPRLKCTVEHLLVDAVLVLHLRHPVGHLRAHVAPLSLKLPLARWGKLTPGRHARLIEPHMVKKRRGVVHLVQRHLERRGTRRGRIAAEGPVGQEFRMDIARIHQLPRHNRLALVLRPRKARSGALAHRRGRPVSRKQHFSSPSCFPALQPRASPCSWRSATALQASEATWRARRSTAP